MFTLFCFVSWRVIVDRDARPPILLYSNFTPAESDRSQGENSDCVGELHFLHPQERAEQEGDAEGLRRVPRGNVFLLFQDRLAELGESSSTGPFG